jgi:hypothetical protein
MKIIGIAGAARSGKDTLARMLILEAGEGAHMSFAAPIREFIANLLNVPVEALQDGAYKERPLPELGGISPRQMMQTLGTEWGRDLVDPDLWIKVAEWKLKALQESMFPPAVVVFSDVRFENEADVIRRLGGVVVHLRRPGAKAVAAHVSEAGISQRATDWHISNHAGLDELRQGAQMVLQHGFQKPV